MRIVRLFGVLLLLALVVAVAQVTLYEQADDELHTASKKDYLRRIGDGRHPESRPNLVVILFDDLGLGDIGVYGGSIPTPNIDRLAREGLTFTRGYSASPYCTASRAALLTGRYAVRSGLDHVLQPSGTVLNWLLRIGGRNLRLPAEEITLPEVLSAAGYETAIVGKWHLGEESPSLPNDRRFDRFYGLLFSNDQGEPALWRNRAVEEQHPIEQATLTRRYTREAVSFIEGQRERPFFLYLPHTFPHIPLYAAEDRRGRSTAGLYGDVVEELDWSVGEVMAALERSAAREQTLVVVTSDNGPWFQGSPGGMRGRKLDVFEGGMRVPLVASWPGRIAAGTISDRLTSGLDLFPTVLDLLDIPPPDDRLLDGSSLAPLFTSTVEALEERPLFYYQIASVKAVRSGRFKYHARRGVFFGNPMDWPWGPMRRSGPWLFDLELDPDESYDVSEHRPREAERLRRLLEEHDRQVSRNPRGWRESGEAGGE
jgi:arylsulfatase A-like enzyme